MICPASIMRRCGEFTSHWKNMERHLIEDHTHEELAQALMLIYQTPLYMADIGLSKFLDAIIRRQDWEAKTAADQHEEGCNMAGVLPGATCSCKKANVPAAPSDD